MQFNTIHPFSLGSKLLLLILLSLVFSISGYSGNARIIEEFSKISWSRPYFKDNYTIIPGSIKMGTETLNIFWKIGANNNLHLYTGQLNHEEELFPLYQTNGLVRAFRGLPSNTNNPSKLQQVFVAKTTSLHQALKKPVSFKIYNPDPKISLIEWRKPYTQNQAIWVSGKVSASFGTLNLYWKCESANEIKLIILTAKSGAERAPREEKLILMANQDGTTTIFKIQQPLNNRFESPTLNSMVTVGTANLNDGLALIKGSD